MTRFFAKLNLGLWALLASLAAAGAQEASLDELFELLRSQGLEDYEAVQEKIELEWSKSGSDAMDLLLHRGREAMEEGDLGVAIEHFTALTDHAPEFAEGWNALATAYFMRGLYGPSLEAIERTLALNPRHYNALSGLGIILRELGRDRQALEAFRRAHELTPHRPDLTEAVAALEAAVEGVEL